MKIEIPNEVGYYEIGGTYFAIYRKPSRLHRLAALVILGWRWHDKAKQQSSEGSGR